jgi:cyclophilin family peptidyl-prolyl cis-trans isomerase
MLSFISLHPLKLLLSFCIIISATVHVRGTESIVDKDPKRVACLTTKGEIMIEVYPDWAPIGASRFLDLVRSGFYTDIAMFRTVEGFLSQFGISDQPKFKYSNPNFMFREIPDDVNLNLGIKKNYMSFAGSGPNSRGTQIFIAFADLHWLGPRINNGQIDGSWETPFAKVVNSDSILEALYKGYGEKPDQHLIHDRGNAYIRENFPKMDFINSCRVLEESFVDSRELHELGVHSLAAMGDAERLKMLYEHFPEIIHFKDSNQWQPIHEASRSGHYGVVKFLLDNGADMGE